MSNNQQTLLQLYCREQQDQTLLAKHDLDSDLSESADYLKWCESKRNFVEEDVLGQTWVKSCPAGYITEVHFHFDGSLTEYRLFDRFETQGHWQLRDGLLHVEILKGENHYQFAVVARADLNIHSTVEYKNGELHSYLKLVQVER
ncbi:hypothetical protein [Vibrio cyclitrophicus]|uniref:Uncharacterized protein n=1 Tax=Vibrio cyclitrophicus ZF270 TaxID=1136176 RepID=A0AAN0LNZ3_9VIBR|nr:hypothetical protein [Vibrio cyclitrophicus]KNH13939.1 hypothetical protein ACS79_03800 [Vibrio lentus]MBY7662731.1 hypothetical protein [Vibrio atlanticus]ERM60612.1 hypothetical protein M565_ctg1P0804 [Vibrio cyclitrophicus FF75]KAA8597144.1 hypothetical protein F0Z19_4324 [Vibrio cyclitrophicus]OBT24977.1 hypothetical protein A9263_07145 [Vibrio cyclitrophicus]